MWARALAILAAGFLTFSPMMWPHDAAETVLAVTTGIAALLLVPASIADRRAGWALAVAGFTLGISNFLFHDNALTVAVRAATGLVFITAGFAFGEGAGRQAAQGAHGERTEPEARAGEAPAAAPTEPEEPTTRAA
jgi:hypothetical protein